MGINRLREEGDVNISLPPGFSPAGQTRESLAREPAFLLFLFLPLFLPILPLHSSSNRWNTNRNGVSTLTAYQTPDARLQNPSSVVSRHQRTYVSNSICMESSTTEGAPVVEGLPEEVKSIGKKKKRQRRKHAHHRQQFTRAQFPDGQFPPKFGCQPIKLEV